MNQTTLSVTVGALLHDVGKPEYRRGLRRDTHSELGYALLHDKVKDRDILNCVRYHHASALKNARLPDSSPCYAVYIGDNIASGCDRRDYNEGGSGGKFEPLTPLMSVFGTINGIYDSWAYKAALFDGSLVSPVLKNSAVNTSEDYSHIMTAFTHELDALNFTDGYVNSLLAAEEACFSYIPAATQTDQLQDISLFDHLKMTAACACCISLYCEEKGKTNLRAMLFDGEKSFRDEKAFLMYSTDVSGIQSFIYNIPSSSALKSLRSRSFSLELLSEHFIDELLDAAGLSRCNLIYSGGGHCYILLPNTESVKAAVAAVEENMRLWLIDSFGASLYFASASYECSANELMNIPAEKTPYSEIFVGLSRKLSEKKMRRYTADELRRLNSLDNGAGKRECKVCGRSDLKLSDRLCENCARFAEMGRVIVKPGLTLAVTRSKPKSGRLCWALPSINGNVWLSFIENDETGSETRALIAEDESNIVRVYTKNRLCTGLRFARTLYVGDYCHQSDLGELFKEAEQDGAGGIKRIAVARADVDELGRAFISGFENDKAANPSERYKYVTISRTAAFSRQMSVFFRCAINNILRDKSYTFDNKPSQNNRVNIVYSGGDDIFIVGMWDDVIESLITIRDDFGKYCCEALTISAGIGVFTLKYPISDAARYTAELEDTAKAHIEEDGTKKDAVTLFTSLDGYTFRWDDLRDSIIGDKIVIIRDLLEYKSSADSDTVRLGKAMLYNMLSLIRAADERINIARFAYMLTRLEPKTKDSEYINTYRIFADAMLKWIKNKKDRDELVAAIQIYAYMTRGISDGLQK